MHESGLRGIAHLSPDSLLVSQVYRRLGLLHWELEARQVVNTRADVAHDLIGNLRNLVESHARDSVARCFNGGRAPAAALRIFGIAIVPGSPAHLTRACMRR